MGTPIRQGTHADRPAASSANAGQFYFETNTGAEGTLFCSDGTTWNLWDGAVVASSTAGTALLLEYVANTDLIAGAVSANVWTDVCANQTFTVASAGSVVEIAVATGLSLNATGGARLAVDTGGTPIYKGLGGGINGYTPGGNGGTRFFSGLAAGAHTVKVQVNIPAGGSAYCRASTQAVAEPFALTVVEHKN